MSIRSMTGFGHGSATVGGIHAEVEISSVNRKQLDVVLSLPRPLSCLEARLHEEVAAEMSRGRISISIKVKTTTVDGGHSVRLDYALARAYLEAFQKAGKALGIPADVNVRMLAELPGVLAIETPEEDPEKVWPAIQRALRQALQKLDQMRLREGRALAIDLSKRIDRLTRLSSKIRRRVPGSVEGYRRSLARRVQAIRRDIPIDPDRIEREVVMFADRVDITEECTRIESHLNQARQLLRGSEPAGRALDFLAQELNREINTIASKSADREIAKMSVMFRAELERFREQVQNVQ